MNTANTALGPQFDQYQTLIRAVSVGMGLGLVPECLVQQELARGEVVTPLPGRGVELESGYYLLSVGARGDAGAARVQGLAARRIGNTSNAVKNASSGC